MKKANWILKNDEIFSLDFDDFYYNIKEPLKERNGIYIDNAFSNAFNKLTILELGFGLGLNFFLSAKRAIDLGIKLHYVAIENYYQSIDDIRYFCNKFGIELNNNFINDYPPCKDGIYRIEFDGVVLDLVFQDVNIALKDLDFLADVVYADGFSPNKNKEMFSKETLKYVKKLLKLTGKLVSYSSNSDFKKSLIELGFEIHDINLGIKRESTLAILKHKDLQDDIEGYFHKNYLEVNNIAIIGGGIAGATIAYELSKLGKTISVFEQSHTLANEGSGNKIGLLTALIQNPSSLLGEFSQFSFWHSSKFYKKLGYNLEGILEHAYTDELRERFKLQKDNPLIKLHFDFAYLKDGGTLEPCKLVPKIFAKSNTRIFLNYKLNSFREFYDRVELDFDNKTMIFDAVIFASGAYSKEIFSNLPLSVVRGQATWLKNKIKYKHPISSKAYITGAKDGIILLGATYDRNLIAEASREYDDININNFKEIFKADFSDLVIGNRVGYRSYSSDRFPIVGAYFNEEKYKNLYKSLQFDKHKPQVNSPRSRIFINTAHGSRGLSSAITSARLIASYFNNTPSGMFKRYEYALHPARFLIRDLKKGLVKD
ncbi:MULTISPECIES: bifunctional tRNA (5-methylaminomethyl-2-thiouridine)(34)-methyltransferase MnmD/FAD-dependent 5-carboxymethylaminomethyl-2-thiouridine(34) oxidoreductase MnmC [unclassified Campylobacter]|uniref:bifunctional tRNA (5-methylaminomethyl-2-thiouridine)(34)-methyltransferase MnmD/FAD-dependent 5-carboxymethylaminomethyl-2-thiouridine(34) oxidoreductase MnmC n=1 Tax=unclassified Campylobacter TaxID=2593542 RepID=UPI001DFDEC78|nr:bifunctional tRNA (5-methylaminomethyl-2-thiouridine)(34)-methyltransferase MnmD/FAD-dependent 5-carboxymethylaminomethyl-2-thiouridine(34) oxidoreductase MnmC [Campylobacter sp. RM12637]MBZ7991041.1 bifunctional tRNA (5-methylaminomethyl-2-thiouridine)(34)-methyltransferase MnmD/FAD-dependent 5-carboxymethylaminomethyl-2-thiouridine(34) oxidoreductase MnmC [Campylobacter sp. RM9331]MBZ8005233.1 bifunctional tRNA (5-methylaminomethyl-2-thiouridine)(34)-methyltransferase MnmD/FAD-dependent 5-ca